jgi:pimeloyl-ACP methyl ester carboxylesterase
MSLAFEEVRLSLPHIEVAAHLYGPEDGRPVIALHGWLDNAATFHRLAPLLEGVRIVALDLPGHGHSQHRPVGVAYNLWDYAHDVLQVAEQFGWQRFALLGHSMGAIVSALLAGAMPQRVERLALIDGVLPLTGEPESAPARLGAALEALLAVEGKQKPVYPTLEMAVAARLKGVAPVSRGAAELLAQRGLMPVPGGLTWRTDARLTMPSTLRLTHQHALAFLARISCPVSLVVASRGLVSEGMVREAAKVMSFDTHRLEGGHHLHLDDQAGAEAVAAVFADFLVS